MSCGRAHFRAWHARVRVAVPLRRPAGSFLRLVAGRTQTLPVVSRSGSSRRIGLDVVVLPDGSVAVGGLAALVPYPKEFLHSFREESCSRVHGQERIVLRMREQPFQPYPRPEAVSTTISAAAAATKNHLAGQRRRDGFISHKHRRIVCAAEQGTVGHDQLKGNVRLVHRGAPWLPRSPGAPILHRLTAILCGPCWHAAVVAEGSRPFITGGVLDEAVHECIGHELAFPALVAGSFGTVRNPRQGRENSHPLFQRDQCSQKRHPVGGRAKRDMAVANSLFMAFHERLRVKAIGGFPAGGSQFAAAQERSGIRVAADNLVNACTVRQGQEHGFLGHQ